MFRIHFNPKTSQFEVQILIYTLLWQTAKGMNFDTLTEAQARVEQIGLDKLYANKSANKFREHLSYAL